MKTSRPTVMMLAFAILAAPGAVQAQDIGGGATTQAEADGDCVMCWELTCWFGLTGHKTAENPFGNIKNPHEVCLDAPCPAGHPPCSFFNLKDQDLDDTIARVFDGDQSAFIALLDNHRDRVSVNVFRMGLEVAGNEYCDEGRMIAYIPLTVDQLAEVVGRGSSVSLASN